MAGQEEWRALAAALRRALAGERDLQALLAGLDATDTIVAGDVLRGLGVEVDAPAAPTEEGPAEEGVSLAGFLQLVARACRPEAPPGLAEQLHVATRNMAAQAGLPEELRALGRVLNHILSGERDPDLLALSPELADAVREMLAGLV